ncbi:sensor histidine kinase [Kiloniella sp. b19]|uniref:sensor histidine kinase n=1 Tax=Kiloniella sp. GXU_MW_B19 TaxID=3141326 RepID=UPI0031E35FA2
MTAEPFERDHSGAEQASQPGEQPAGQSHNEQETGRTNDRIPPARSWRIVIWLSLLALYGFATWSLIQWVKLDSVQQTRQSAQHRLVFYQDALLNTLNKYTYLPYILSRNEDVISLLEDIRRGETRLDHPENTSPDSIFSLLPERSIAVSSLLNDTNRKAKSSALYVMSPNGTTLASSNWQTDRSFVGHNYSYRPFFKDAMKGREGQFFAVGAVSKTPGFYFSHPVYEKEQADSSSRPYILGVTVVKVDISSLQDFLQQGEETVFMTDAYGVIFLSSNPDWLYKTLTPLHDEQKNLIRSFRQYGQAALSPLPVTTKRYLDRTTLYQIDKSSFLLDSRPIGSKGWVLHYASPVKPIDASTARTGLFAVLILIAILSLLFFVRARRFKRASLIARQETEQVRRINQRLEREIEERKRTEEELRNTQEGLVQTGKLAALGQMSAAIAHEINQPLAAIRNYAASVELLLRKDRVETALQSVSEIRHLTQRMGSITGQLKTFARKAPSHFGPVDLHIPLDRALSLISPYARNNDTQLIVMMDTGSTLSEPVTVLGDEVRLEQVFINVIRNAIDALQEKTDRKVWVNLKLKDPEQVQITIRDNGPGLSNEARQNLFDPFFTTKPVGEGVGLGLSISYGIVKDLRGDILAENHSSGGAVFRIVLPLHSPEEQHDQNV